MKDTPPAQLFLAKRKLNWVYFRKLYGIKLSRAEVNEDHPMTEEAFMSWAENVRQMSRAAAMSWWSEMKRDAEVDRDNEGRCSLGRLGELRLWVPNAVEKRGRKQEVFIENQMEQELGANTCF